jgi:hypothetical protein
MPEVNDNKWYCYFCGKKLGELFAIWSGYSNTDRGFFCCDAIECTECIQDGDVIELWVKREEVLRCPK